MEGLTQLLAQAGSLAVLQGPGTFLLPDMCDQIERVKEVDWESLRALSPVPCSPGTKSSRLLAPSRSY